MDAFMLPDIGAYILVIGVFCVIELYTICLFHCLPSL